MTARRLLIAWWSNTGGTEALVRAAADAAREAARDAPGTLEVASVRCDRLGPDALLRADGLVLAAPECLGSMAGPMKAFVDRCWYPALDRLAGRPYGAMVCAGSDGHGTLRQFDRIAAGWRLRRVAEPVLAITGAQTPEAIAAPKRIAAADLARAAELGATLGVGLSLGVW
ncbi:MAG: hypothetical protein RJA99_4500 [Pseudomonadota bacterium]